MAELTSGAKKYNAFLSYGHEDKWLAEKLRAALHSFASSWLGRRAVRIHRDEDSMAPGHDLLGTLKKSISDSEYFLLLASPDAAQSPYVKAELEAFLEQNDISKLIIVRARGELNWDKNEGGFKRSERSAFPDVGRRLFEKEPKWEDLIWAKADGKDEDLSLKNVAFQSVVAGISAKLRGMSKDELYGKDLERRRRLVWVFGTLAAAVALVAVVAVFQALRARREARIALSRGLAAKSALFLSREPNLLQTSALLAVEALRETDDAEALETLTESLQLLPHQTQLLRHDAAVKRIAFMPDGRRLVTADVMGVNRVWDIAHGAAVASTKHDNYSDHLAVSSDGRFVLSYDGWRVYLWDWNAPEPNVRVVHDRRAREAHFSHDGRHVAVAPYDDKEPVAAYVYETESGRPAAVLKASDEVRERTLFDLTHPVLFSPDNATGRSLAFSPDGRRLATGEKGHVTLWEDWAQPRARVARKLPLQGAVLKVVFSRDGERMAALNAEELHVWDMEDFGETTQRPIIPGVFREVKQIALSPSGEVVASLLVGADAANIWEAGGVSQEGPRLAHRGIVEAVDFCPEEAACAGDYVATAGHDGTVRLWDYLHGSGDERARMTHDGPVTALAFSPDGRALATAGDDKTVRLWDYASAPAVKRSVQGHGVATSLSFEAGRDTLLVTSKMSSRMQVTSLDVAAGKVSEAEVEMPGLRVGEGLHGVSRRNDIEMSHGGRYVAAGSNDELRVVERTTKREVGAVKLPGRVLAFSFSADGRYLAASFYPEEGVADYEPWRPRPMRVRVWEVEGLRAVGEVDEGHEGSGVAVSPGGLYVATYDLPEVGDAAGRPEARVREVRGGAVQWESVEGGRVTALAFSPDGTRFVECEGQAVRVRDIKSGRVVLTFEHRGTVQATAFSADGRLLASAADDLTARVWEVAGREEVGRVPLNVRPFKLAFSGGGDLLAAVGAEPFMNARVWRWRRDDLMREAASLLTRNLTRAEWQSHVGVGEYRKTFENLPGGE